MPYVSLPFVAAVTRDESPLAAKPAFIGADKMRAVAGKMETLYGQEIAASSALVGVCRGGLAWADLARTAWAAFGTHLRLQVIDQDGILYDATPVIARGELSSPFAVSSGSTTVTVVDDAHGLVVDQLVTFPTAASAVNVVLSGSYVISSVVSSSAFTITASTAAQSTASVGGMVDIEYGLAPGNISNLGGLGCGTGGYGAGGYGGPSEAQDLDARSWSFANWGQNLIARYERKNWELAAARQARDAAALLAKSEIEIRAREQDIASLKDKIKKDHLNAEGKIVAAHRDNARLLAALGGLRERERPGRRGADEVSGNSIASADAAGSAPGAGRLSAEISRALLDLAALADRTAAYAAACHAWATSLPQP